MTLQLKGPLIFGSILLVEIGQIEVTDRLRLGLTVELPSTELIANQYGSYEVFISWEMAALRRQLLKRRYF